MFKRLLLCLTEATPREVVEVALRLSSRETEVHLLHVVRLLTELGKKQAEEGFSWARELFRKEGRKTEFHVVEATEVGKAIVSFAREKNCDGIVLGTIPRKGVLGYLTESVSDYVVKNSPCVAVLVRKPGQPV